MKAFLDIIFASVALWVAIAKLILPLPIFTGENSPVIEAPESELRMVITETVPAIRDTNTADIAALKEEVDKLILLKFTKPVPPPADPIPEIHWTTNLAVAEATAKKLGKPVFINFETERCGPCELVRKQVYETKEVWKQLSENFIPVFIYIAANERGSNKDAARFGITAYPKAVILRPDGTMKVFSPSSNLAEFASQLK